MLVAMFDGCSGFVTLMMLFFLFVMGCRAWVMIHRPELYKAQLEDKRLREEARQAAKLAARKGVGGMALGIGAKILTSVIASHLGHHHHHRHD